MSDDATYMQPRGRAGGFARAAYAQDRQALTKPLRDARRRKREEKILAKCPWLKDDPAELAIRVDLLMRSEMAAMAAKASAARSRAAKARREARDAETALAEVQAEESA